MRAWFAISGMMGLLLFSMAPALAVQSTDMQDHMHTVAASSTPLAQFLDDVPLKNIECSDGLDLIMKKSSGTPACVKPSSVPILIERGWGMHILQDYVNGDNNSDLVKTEKRLFNVTSQDVVYFENYTGYLAIPDTENPSGFPGVVLIHEWWGLNENIKDMAEELASHGYVALAVDLYGGDAATTSEQARQYVSSYDQEKGIANMNGAVEYLESNYGVERVGSIGWCFGGGQSLNLALNNDGMDATVIYYGSITSDKERLSVIDWPVLGIFAGLDTGIPVESVEEFDMALDELGIPNEVHIYPGVNHAFANPSGERYAPEETKDAWKKTLDFFNDSLKQKA